MFRKIIKPISAILSLLFFVAPAIAGDWTEFRGPTRDGISPEKNLPVKWSPAGENLAWKAPYGGRSTPVVFGDRVYLQNPVGVAPAMQERLMCLDANTGKVLWEHRYNIYLSDAPPHRIAWGSPAVDAETGNVYAMSSGGELMAYSQDGKLLWDRSLAEEVGFLTTHGGRISSPIIDGDLVIINGITFSWGSQGRGQHRLMGFNKKTGECYWSTNFAGRPYDTSYAPPYIANVNGTRLLIIGGSDGFVYALKPQTGEFVWKIEVSKRGLNTGVLVKDNIAFISHSEENLASSEMGMLIALDATAKGEVKLEQTKYSVPGWQGGFSSPVIDGDIFYQVDNGANLGAFDVKTGKQIWLQNLGTIQKASLVMGDGKLYVGTENGKFFILKPSATGCQILDSDQLGTEEKPELILASAAISNGRVFVTSDTATYCFGQKPKPDPPRKGVTVFMGTPQPEDKTATYVQVVPTELILKPNEKTTFRARLFNASGQFIREDKATFALDGLKGTLSENGEFTAPPDEIPQGGQVKATVNGVEGIARVRVLPTNPSVYSENFDSVAVKTLPTFWSNGTLKYEVSELEGNKVLAKLTTGSSLLTRSRLFIGPDIFSNYTTESDVYATEKRRQMGDVGVIAQRYMMILFGNDQKVQITPWQPETFSDQGKTQEAFSVPFAWKKDTWYRMKLQVENLPGEKVRARGKVWLASEKEPDKWTIERVDNIGNRRGSPGLFGNALAEVYFDNIKVYSNK